MVSSSVENVATECDPLLLQLMEVYSDKNATLMVIVLNQIVQLSCAQSSKQEAFGALDCIKVIFSFFASIAPSASTKLASEEKDAPSDVSSPFSVDPAADDDKEQQRILVEKCYWVLVRLCRREMDKATANAANIEKIESYSNSFELIDLIATQYTSYAPIALPVAWLVMILASDSPERQFKLTAAGTTQLIVSILDGNLDDNAVTEMACRAARNLAAGEADLVAKLVEDKVCNALVRVIHKQLGTSPPVPDIEVEDNHESCVEANTEVLDLPEEITGDDDKDIDIVADSEGCGKQSDLKDISFNLDAITINNINIKEADDLKGLKPNESVCEAVLWAIVNLSCEENVATILGSVGGIEAVISLAEKCQRNCSISLAAISAIRNISAVGTLSFSLLAKTKVCEVLLDILKEHSSDLEIVETGIWTITNLACDSVLSNRLGSLGAASIILDLYFSIVPHHPVEGRPAGPISESILWSIVNLSAGGIENEERLGIVGCVELVCHILMTYVNREGMADVALNALVHLIYHSDENKMRVGNNKISKNDNLRMEIKNLEVEVFKTVCHIIEKYEDNENIAENAFQFFLLSLNGSMESNFYNKEKLLSMNIILIISKIMFTNSVHAEIIRLGCGLLLVIRFDDDIYKQKLKAAQQLDERGKAKPSGTYQDIAVIWECTDPRAVSTVTNKGPMVSSVQMHV